MWFRSAFDALVSRVSRSSPRKLPRAPSARPLLESLEDRWVLSFTPLASYAAGVSPYLTTPALIDSDNVLDLVVANSSTNSISVLLGNGDGTFQDALGTNPGYSPSTLAVGDFDEDGNTDIVTATSGKISVLLGNGDGTFQTAQDIALPGQFPPGYTDPEPLTQSPNSVVVGDVDGDGNLDLVVTANTFFRQYAGSGYYGPYYNYFTNGHVNVLLGNGAGDFADPTVQLLENVYPIDAILHDFDGGGLDLAVADYYNTSVRILTGNGDGSFTPSAQYSTYGSPTTLFLADATSDGRDDLIAVNYGSVSVLPANADGTFQARQDTFWYANGVAVGDVNDDGKIDLVGVNNDFICTSHGYYGCYDGYYVGNASVIMGYGDGSFSLPSTSGLGVGYSYGPALGDFDGDTLPDLATVNSSDGRVAIAQNDGNFVLPAAVKIDNVTIVEGDNGTLQAVFTVTLKPGGNTGDVTVSYSTVNGGALAGSDYVAKSDTLTFHPGDTSLTITILVNGDLTDEYDQEFYVSLTGASGADILDGWGTGTIQDNDPPPKVSIGDASTTEGGKGKTKQMQFIVTLSAPSEKEIYVYYETANGTATTQGNDYRAQSSYVYFSAGQTSQTISITIRGDSTKEANETFFVNLTSAFNADLLDAQAIGTILNDDGGGKGKGGR